MSSSTTTTAPRPTLVTDVPADAPFSCEETFGPLASIETVGGELRWVTVQRGTRHFPF